MAVRVAYLDCYSTYIKYFILLAFYNLFSVGRSPAVHAYIRANNVGGGGKNKKIKYFSQTCIINSKDSTKTKFFLVLLFCLIL